MNGQGDKQFGYAHPILIMGIIIFILPFIGPLIGWDIGGWVRVIGIICIIVGSFLSIINISE